VDEVIVARMEEVKRESSPGFPCLLQSFFEKSQLRRLVRYLITYLSFKLPTPPN
jgi:hypothetical protein